MTNENEKEFDLNEVIQFCKENTDQLLSNYLMSLRASINLCWHYGNGMFEDDDIEEFRTEHLTDTDYSIINNILDMLIDMEKNTIQNKTMKCLNIEAYELIRKCVTTIKKGSDILATQELIENPLNHQKLLLLIDSFEVVVWRLSNGWNFQ